jgi:pimeloyl-ACP methyl ester carboxylesterase
MFKRIVKYFFYSLAIIYLCLAHGCETLKVRASKQQLQQQIVTPFLDSSIIVNAQPLRFIAVGNKQKPALVLLHGSPSSLSGWKAIYTDTTFTNNYFIVAIDRPGYGFSNFGTVETNIHQQAKAVAAVLQCLSLHTNVSIIGSSYGGPVAVQTVINHPQQFKQLVLLSASVKPNAEKVYFISHFMTMPFVEYLFPAIFRMSSKEKLSHAKQLETVTNWQNITCKAVIIHGNADDLIYYDNALYAQQQLTQAKPLITVTLQNKGHALIFTEPNFIKKVLLQYL